MDSRKLISQPTMSLSSRHQLWMQSYLAGKERKLNDSTTKNVHPKSLSIVQFDRKQYSSNALERDTRKVITSVVDDIIEQKQGFIKLSDSECSLEDDLQDSLSMDHRLKHWYNTLKDRATVQAKIARQVGRRPDEMLINLPSTVGPRDRGAVERLLDLAGRMNPTVLAQRQPAVLPAQPVCVEKQYKCLPDLQETLPLAERRGTVEVEVSGLTHATKNEIMGRPLQAPENRAQWLQSEVLGDRIEQQSDNIKRVLEFYPEVDSLEVVSASMQKETLKGSSTSLKPIERVSAASMVSISNTTTEETEQEDQEKDLVVDVPAVPDRDLEPDPELTGAAVRINGVLFQAGMRCASTDVGHFYFECHPYQNVVQEVMVLENVGCQMLTCQWAASESSRRGPKSLPMTTDYFLIPRSLFVVFPGEKHVCRALFRPRDCVQLKMRLEILIYPNVLGFSRSHIMVQLTGKCVPSPEYTGQLRRQLKLVLDKSKQRFTKDLAQQHASLVPLLQPHEVVCPYERVFDEREVFNSENPGYHCDRFDDLEALKALYQELKKPREPAWDLRLQTILTLILRQPKTEQRRHHYARFVEIKESMKPGVNTRRAIRFGSNEERDRSRFIYVRGCIGNGIQDWEDMMASLELSALKSEVTRYQAKQRDLEKKHGDDDDEDSEPKPWMRQLRQENETLYLLKKLRSRKPYRDSLYMQTYSHLCDMAEDVVSIIESTQYV
ncbi:uncharacterized protein [Drosophila kikkawai]|uniref:Uncharacterized protein n=1 Tax=Drosophila kikkawai TaxID=30033 RepID=A0ABM3C6C0_DROKI|nr:uncharacterized protein LOC121502399 [Drosophila kikkawai]